jgi:signal transduction histidine kinase
MLANLTALALRDLNLDAAERDRAAMKAYASKLTGNILRETSDSRLLMWIFTEARGCIELLDKRRVDRKTLATSLERVRQLAAEARTGPSLERDSSPCKLENVIENIRKDNEPHKRYLELPKLESSFPLAAPEFAVRSILQCLIQNAVEAIELGDEKARKDGFVKLEVTGADDYVDVTVTDNGPGIPRKIEERILREPVESHTGRGTGLLVARGAALVAGGDLSLEIPRDKTVFRLRLPKLRKR